MASVNLSPLFNGQTLFGPTALPLTGGQIFTYQAGSTTPLTTYTTSSGNIAQTNPVVLGTDGKLVQELWLQSGYSYKFVVEDSTNAIIATYDNIAGIITQLPTVAPVVPAGCILIWSSSTGSIPSGFVICDGSNGTPDLRNSFVLGAGNSYAVGQVGGSTDSSLPIHTHTATSTLTSPGHQHFIANTDVNPGNIYPTLSSTNYMAYKTGGGGISESYALGGSATYPSVGLTDSVVTGDTVSTTNSNSGTSPSNLNMPPYYALAYIMKT
jgi:hypothetical protein